MSTRYFLKNTERIVIMIVHIAAKGKIRSVAFIILHNIYICIIYILGTHADAAFIPRDKRNFNNPFVREIINYVPMISIW